MRLIDADKIQWKSYPNDYGETNDDYVEKCDIDNMPTVDAVPVRHAEWVVCGDGDNVPWMCSHCGKTTAHKYKVIYGKYCPNCGAMMDGGIVSGR